MSIKEVYSTEEAAEYLNMSPGTLENWRNTKEGPTYCKPARKVYYLKKDLDDWVQRGRVENQ